MGEAAVDTDAMRRAAEQACALMKALSNPDRLLLPCELGEVLHHEKLLKRACQAAGSLLETLQFVCWHPFQQLQSLFSGDILAVDDGDYASRFLLGYRRGAPGL